MFGNAPDLPGFSMLRLLRLLRISRVLRMVPELLMMVKSLAAAIRSVSMTFVLALGIMYIFSIILTQWAVEHEQIHVCEDGDDCALSVDEAFGTISKSLLTLTQVLCFDDTFSLIRATLQESLIYGLLIIVFILLAAFTVLNMLIGVICEIVSSTTEEEREKILREKVEYLFESMDVDGSGSVSRTEFMNMNSAKQLEKLGIDRQLLQHAFDIIDCDEDGALEMEEFLEVIFKLLHPPEAQDVILLKRKLERLASGLRDKFEALKNEQKKRDPMVLQEGLRMPMPALPSLVLGQRVDELEQQIHSMSHHFVELAGIREDAGGDNMFDKGDIVSARETELRTLDAGLHRLRARLDRCTDELSSPRLASGAVAEPGGGAHWKRLCLEVSKSISGTSALLAQAAGPPKSKAGSSPRDSPRTQSGDTSQRASPRMR
eukprot:gnl/TRDRNA2_/TRDRNA2_124774_c1_seq1.p1 gnl/TRDRNA2_/TRDRNA2_124774_c1~~gnl/TRDRNA2_/TRDRNA2_124774_c1_seq1.p1  ORF type:complete len:456 (+),score=93.72 gnl/TRDRNA2_/TRDRNA2_124774_c1_seq1:73-1368(+)